MRWSVAAARIGAIAFVEPVRQHGSAAGARGKGRPQMTIAPVQGLKTGNAGIVPPWLQGGGRPVTPPPTTVDLARTRDVLVGIPTRDGIIIVDVPGGISGHDHTPGVPSSRRGFGAVDSGRRGASFAREQSRIDSAVRDVQARFAKLGVRESEGNGPVTAMFVPDFPNAAYAPEGLEEYGMPADSIGVGIDPRSGRSFAEAEDVVAHELAHRVVDHMTKRPLSMDPRSEDVAIHESLSDTFAALVDDDQEWTLGEDLIEPVRIMDHPERLGHPGKVSDLKTVLATGSPFLVPIGTNRATGEEVMAPDWHVVAAIPNKAASIIGKELGKEGLGKIYINAIRNYLEPGKEIEGLASATLKSASELYGAGSRELQATKDAWDAVGVLKLLKQ